MNRDRSSFDKAFEQRQRQFNMIWKIAIGFIVLSILLVVAQFVFVGYVGYKTVPTIEQKGLKGAIESIWYGKEGQR
jgi:hypothetical protein